MKMNCWEFYECGREPGGHSVERRGACQAPMDEEHNGTNCGKNGGRYCWSVMSEASKREGKCCKRVGAGECCECLFYKLVKGQEGEKFVP